METKDFSKEDLSLPCPVDEDFLKDALSLDHVSFFEDKEALYHRIDWRRSTVFFQFLTQDDVNAQRASFAKDRNGDEFVITFPLDPKSAITAGRNAQFVMRRFDRPLIYSAAQRALVFSKKDQVWVPIADARREIRSYLLAEIGKHELNLLIDYLRDKSDVDAATDEHTLG